MLETVITDLPYAARTWRRAPIVTVSVTIAVALGIAATTAIFSVMEAVFLRPLPFPASGQLVRFSTTVGTLGRVIRGRCARGSRRPGLAREPR
ncbi:MAG TPA: hypothetical protein VFT24_04835 [Vicinamibacterales bacterium]|nr:hypothetical protein [Vicinamibacterales bacterium]